jgi:hypothetical protein
MMKTDEIEMGSGLVILPSHQLNPIRKNRLIMRGLRSFGSLNVGMDGEGGESSM